MKSLIKFGLLSFLAASMFLAPGCAGSYYVTDQPVEPVYERPTAPYANAVWVEGEWSWSGGNYVYTRGHWDHPREGHSTYVRGNWEHTNRGYKWHNGHWQ